MATSEQKNTHGLVKFIGFGGLVTLLAVAASVGEMRATVSELAHSEAKMDVSIEKIADTLNSDKERTDIQSYQIASIEKRLDQKGIK